MTRLQLSRKAMGAAADSQALREECRQLREQLRQSVSKEELRPALNLLDLQQRVGGFGSAMHRLIGEELARLQKLREVKP